MYGLIFCFCFSFNIYIYFFDRKSNRWTVSYEENWGENNLFCIYMEKDFLSSYFHSAFLCNTDFKRQMWTWTLILQNPRLSLAVLIQLIIFLLLKYSWDPILSHCFISFIYSISFFIPFRMSQWDLTTDLRCQSWYHNVERCEVVIYDPSLWNEHVHIVCLVAISNVCRNMCGSPSVTTMGTSIWEVSALLPWQNVMHMSA